ncbi:glycosyltransferase family 39 protein [Methylococcus sp. EFPC2]|uniref:ArnT family glycosyltransferase n=1 Tax=Methylococcus sp. EFPC2 TaxID=2812648 RepID=UPI00196780C0|nr:glycosyltransferase family 39 protein [Methylococcus sp. EFPC2]QSA98303.1 glycosyltransferase family 39 protein [Methylococcus sp. EFPC2]
MTIIRHLALRKDYVFVWLALVLMGLAYRPLTPVDETRAVTVAWEMWSQHQWLVPHLNGEPYSHKPPLLLWGINLMWLVFGVNEWSARLLPSLFALGNLLLTERLARRLWPEAKSSARLAPWLLLAMPVWAMWSSLTLYDMLTTTFVLVGLHGISRAGRGETRIGWIWAGLGIGGGVLAKGPVILLLVLPVALGAPWWGALRPDAGWGNWYRGLLGAVLLGAAMGLAWAIPAGFAGGEEYRRMIFWGQSAGRIANAFAHQRPVWWYLEILPLLMFPWVLWPPLWRGLRRIQFDPGLRFCALHAASVFLIFSLISGKQVHYLLPALPSAALLLARLLGRGDQPAIRNDQVYVGFLLLVVGLAFTLIPVAGSLFGLPESLEDAVHIADAAPLTAKLVLLLSGIFLLRGQPGSRYGAVRALTLSMLALLFSAHLVYRQVGWTYYDMLPFAQRLSAVQQQERDVAYFGKYSGDFQFLGRLERRLEEIEASEAFVDWLKRHPEDYAVIIHRHKEKRLEEGAEFGQFYRGSRRITLWKAAELVARPDVLKELME